MNSPLPLRPFVGGLFLLTAVALTPADTAAQSYANTVWSQLQSVYDRASSNGYSSKHYLLSTLEDDGTDQWNFSFEAGAEYQIVGVCDEDCSDLDLTVKTTSGTVIDSDTSSDDVPIVTIRPPGNGHYTIEAKMYNCSSEPCYYGIGLFKK